MELADRRLSRSPPSDAAHGRNRFLEGIREWSGGDFQHFIVRIGQYILIRRRNGVSPIAGRSSITMTSIAIDACGSPNTR